MSLEEVPVPRKRGLVIVLLEYQIERSLLAEGLKLVKVRDVYTLLRKQLTFWLSRYYKYPVLGTSVQYTCSASAVQDLSCIICSQYLAFLSFSALPVAE
jgi:hypothetical protein